MTPVIVAAVVVTATVCAVAAYVLLLIQARGNEAQKADLRFLLNQAAAGRQEAEARVRELSGEDEWVRGEMDRIEAFYADTAHDPATGDNAPRRNRG